MHLHTYMQLILLMQPNQRVYIHVCPYQLQHNYTYHDYKLFLSQIITLLVYTATLFHIFCGESSTPTKQCTLHAGIECRLPTQNRFYCLCISLHGCIHAYRGQCFFFQNEDMQCVIYCGNAEKKFCSQGPVVSYINKYSPNCRGSRVSRNPPPHFDFVCCIQ